MIDKKILEKLDKEALENKDAVRNKEALRKILAKREVDIPMISTDALCRLCFRYDLYYHEYPESAWEGLSLYCFLLGLNDKDMWRFWEEELKAQWKREKEEEIE